MSRIKIFLFKSNIDYWNITILFYKNILKIKDFFNYMYIYKNIYKDDCF